MSEFATEMMYKTVEIDIEKTNETEPNKADNEDEESDEDDIINALRKEWDEEDDEETQWTDLWYNGELYYVNPEQTRWIKSDDMIPFPREYYPGMEKDIDYNDLQPIIDE